jgi:oligopeptide transport system substrate-binding protein
MVAVVCALALAACDSGPGYGNRRARAQPVPHVLVDGRPDPASLATEQVLQRDNGQEPQTLDPHLAEGVPAANILRDLFEGLTGETPDGEVVPGAAERWNVSRDGLTYTFYLRRDARWSNGDPLLAEDFAWSLRRSADPRTASSYAHVLKPIENAAAVLAGRLPPEELAVAALDDYVLQIRLHDPTPYFLGLLNHSSTYPVHRASVEALGAKFSRPGNLVSNGAFVLTAWKVRSLIALERNPHYWDVENVLLQRVNYYPLEDQSAALKQFRAGELHWTFDVPASQFDWLREHFPDELVVSPWMGSYFYGYNLLREPFEDNPGLRRALTLALDRDLLTRKVTRFGELPAWTLVPPGMGEYQSVQPEWVAWTQPEREEEARRLYALAGYTAQRPLVVEIRYNTSENHKKLALAMASMWKQVLGVQARLVNEEWKVFLQNRQHKVLTQVFRAGWISDYADPYSFLEQFRSDHGQNDYGYSNRLYDSLLDQVAAERIPARRRRLMQEAERILLEDQPVIPVYTYVTKRLVDRHLVGWQNNVMDHHYSKYMALLKTAESGEPGDQP